MKRSDPPQPNRSGVSDPGGSAEKHGVSAGARIPGQRRWLVVVVLSLGLLTAPMLVLWLVYAPGPRSSDHSFSPSSAALGDRASDDERDMRTDAAGSHDGKPKISSEDPSHQAQKLPHPTEDVVAGTEAGGAVDDEDWSGSIERFDENARLFDERLAVFDRELALGLESPKREREVADFFQQRLSVLSPEARTKVKCTPSVCEVHLLSGGSVGSLIADMGPLLRELDAEATGNARAKDDNRSSFRLLLEADDASTGTLR